jgi:hypothetical protein
MENKLAVISQFKTHEHSASDALIRQWLFRFGVEHKEDVAPRLPVWLERFGGMKPEALEPLFRKALDTCKFFPKVSDILEFVEQVKSSAIEEGAARKWDRVLSYAVRRSPDIPDKNPPRISEQTRRAISAAGGLDFIRDCDQESLQWARKRFIEAFVRFAELQQEQFLLPDGEVKTLLAGVAETKALPEAGVSFDELHQRGLNYAKRFSAPNPRIVPRVIFEPAHVVDVEGRRRELARQAELVTAKYAQEAVQAVG